MILKAQQGEDGEYYFPGVEGRRFFLVWEEELVDGEPDTSVRLCSDLAQGDYIVGITDLGESYTVSGTLHYTAPLAPVQEQFWCPFPVLQMPDGTIYLVNSGPHFQGLAPSPAPTPRQRPETGRSSGRIRSMSRSISPTFPRWNRRL